MKRVLLIDDNQHTRTALRMVLESQGLECAEAIDGSAALDWLERETADLVITDNQMPGLTGLEFIERLSTKGLPQRPPVILLSGNLQDADRERAVNAGAYAVLNKPCNFPEFLSLVHLALENPS